MRKFGVLFLYLACMTILVNAGENSERNLGIRKFVSPDYPNVARLAQISGDVHILATVTAQGRVTVADIMSGPPILASYAQKNLLTWEFTVQSQVEKLEIVYRYRLTEPKVYGQVVPSVTLVSPTEVSIVSNFPLPTGHPE